MGHTTPNCWQIIANVSQTLPTVTGDIESSILGTHSMVDYSLWYPKSEASYYITNNANSVTTNITYHGPETVKISNGSCIHIHNIGSTNVLFS